MTFHIELRFKQLQESLMMPKEKQEVVQQNVYRRKIDNTMAKKKRKTKPNANELYIVRQCTYIVFILQCQKHNNNNKNKTKTKQNKNQAKTNKLTNCLNRAETRVVQIVLDGVLCDVCACTANVSFHRST